jgi:hypothetical protein
MAGAAVYYNASTVTRVMAAYWVPMAFIAVCVSGHAVTQRLNEAHPVEAAGVEAAGGARGEVGHFIAAAIAAPPTPRQRCAACWRGARL